jgi:hypothetical protein
MKASLTTGLWLLFGLIGASGNAATPGKYGLAAENKIYAQLLVNQLLAKNPGLVSVGMHCTAPGSRTQTIIASTLNVIGKPSDPPDLGVGMQGETIISPNLKVPKLGIMLPLHDRAGREIGALALAFGFHAGGDQVALLAEATAIRDRVANQIPGLADLFAVPN